MNNFSPYPISDSKFYTTEDKTLYKDTTTGNCLNTQGYTTTMEPNTTAGYHKPINELCKDISGGNNNLYQGASIWNNMTKRKS